jgi:GAF domain-containing protein
MRQALAAANDVTQIGEALREPLQTVVQADTYYLALFNAAADEVTFVMLVEGGQLREVRPLPPEGVIDHILQTRQTLRLTGDVSRALKELGLAHKGSRARRETGDPSASRAYVGAPLLDGERVLGVLAVEDAQRTDAFGDVQVTWLESMARDAGAAVARLRGQAEGARTTAELSQYRARFLQASQAAQSFEQQLQTRAREYTALQEQYAEAVRTAEALDQQSRARGKHAAEARGRHAQAAAAARDLAQAIAQQGEALRQWRARAQAALTAQAPTPQPNLPAQLERELLVASRALGADYAVLYLAGEDQAGLMLSASVGEAGPTAGGDPQALALSALQTQAPVYVAQLEGDARWTATVAEATSSSAQTSANERYHSGLAVPVPATERGQPSGAVVFLNTRADGFDPASAPIARAAASQLAFALQIDRLASALQAQTARFRDLLNEPVTAWAPEPHLPELILEPLPALPEEAEIPVAALTPPRTGLAVTTPETTPPVRPTAAEPTRPLPPSWQPPLLEPALAEAAAAEIPEIQRPTARPLWRRAAIPAAVVLVAVCGLAALARGPLSNMAAGLFGNATDTAPAATQTAPVVLAASATAEVPATAMPTEAPTTAAPPTPTAPPPTITRTAEPTETDTPAETSTPTITPTPPLPPDVVAVALVDLPEGIGGRLRDAPNGNVIGGVPGNTQVHVLAGRETTSDGITWVQIRIPDTGQTGWFAEDLLIYENEPGG